MSIIGVEKLYYAKLTEDDEIALEYGSPVYLPGVQEIGVVPQVTTDKQFAENKVWDQASTLGEVQVSIRRADLTNEESAILLGQTRAAEGGVFASADDEPPYIALLYKSNKSNGKMRYQVLYKGKLNLPEETAQTKTDNTVFQEPTLSGVFQATKNNGLWQYKVDSDDPDCPETIETDFFAEVIIPTEKVEGI